MHLDGHIAFEDQGIRQRLAAFLFDVAFAEDGRRGLEAAVAEHGMRFRRRQFEGGHILEGACLRHGLFPVIL
jgi:hypothetical protein